MKPAQRIILTGREPSQTFRGLGPTVNLAMRAVTTILTGIMGRDSWAMLSLGTPNSISFRPKMLSAAEQPKVLVRRKNIQTYIRGDTIIFQSIL